MEARGRLVVTPRLWAIFSAMAGTRASDRLQLEQLVDEQAALRRVATLVAQGAPTETLFAVVAQQVAKVLRVPLVSIVRYEPDGTATERGSFSHRGTMFRVGTRWSLEGTNVVARVRDSGQPARIDDYSNLTGVIAETSRSVGIRSTVGIPIVVAGRLWGAMVVSSTEPDPLPSDTEAHLGDFTGLVATAIANGEAREEVERLADEQAALRRVATLVAQDVPPNELFGAVAREVGTLLGTDFSGMIRYEGDAAITVATWAAAGEHPPVPERWTIEPGDPAAMIAETRQPARVEDWAAVPGPVAAVVRNELGVSSSVGCPVVVEGRLWGALAVHSKQHTPLAVDTEARIAQFTDLVATAIANAEARAEVARLAQEQAALRRAATLVAREASQAEVFTAIAEEIGQLLGMEEIRMLRYEDDRSAVVVGSSGKEDAFPVGSRQHLDGDTAASRVLRTGRTARIDDYTTTSGPHAETARSIGVRSAVGAPILVEGRLWGAIVTATTRGRPLPPDTESRLAQFTGLMATAIANTAARAEVERLAEEQSALRRVATLVAEGASPSAVLDAVVAEMEGLLEADQVALNRFEAGAEILVLAHRGLDVARTPVGSRVSTEGESVTAAVRRTGRPARMENYEGADGALAELARATGLRSSVAAPIVVDGRLWGLITASWKGEQSPPADTEERMARFAELLDTAIANADGRAQLDASRARLVAEADEARRRVVRDLHDGAQQRMVHTIMLLKLSQRALRAKDEEAESLVAEALEQAERGNAELRELALGILPSALTHGGLRAGVRTVVARLDLPVHFDVTTERFPDEIEASAYFIVAEALTNVVKHSHARKAEVRASVENWLLHLEIRDDGIGGADPDGHGLVGMGDRVTALGGRLEIESPEGAGTLVAVTLPISGG